MLKHTVSSAAVAATGFIFACALFSLFVHPIPANAATISKPANNLGLVGYWSFNEGVGTQAGDFSGNGNHGSFTGDPQWVSGKLGSALEFDGSSDYVEVPDSDELGPTTGLSVSMWFKSDVTLTPTGGTYRALEKGDSYFFVQGAGGATGSGGMNFLVKRGNVNFVKSIGVQLEADTWYHIVGTFDGTDMRVYLDSVQSGVPKSVGGAIDDDNLPLRIGSDDSGKFFDGTIDEVRIYNRALTATEVSALYQSGSARFGSARSLTAGTTLENGLVGHWTFDGSDVTASEAFDQSGKGNTGTIIGATPVIGKLGQALEFDGDGDYVDIDVVANNMTTAGGTMSAWVYTDTTGSTEYIVSARQSTNLRRFYLVRSSSGEFLFSYGSVLHEPTGQTITEGEWHHVLMTWAGSSAVAYFNGVQVGTISGATAANPTTAAIGTLSSSKTNTSFQLDGIIDDVRIYNRALSEAEIKQLYNLGEAKANASSVTLQRGSSLTDGLKGHWTFDGSDLVDNVADVSGNGNHGSLQGFTSTSSAVAIGRHGQALNFDGSSSYVDFGDTINPSLPITFSTHIYIEALPAIKADIAHTDGVTSSAHNHSGAKFGIDSLGKVSASYGDNTDCNPSGRRTKSGTSELTMERWYHVAVVIRGAADMDIYVDGVNDGGTYSGTGGDIVHTTRSGSIGRGTECGSGSMQVFDGTIDDVRIYNRALTEAEIKQLYLIGQ